MKDILQFAIDVEDNNISEEKITEVLEEAGISVYGVVWKSRWTNDGYHHCEPPISCD